MFSSIKRYYDMNMTGYDNEGIKIFVLAGWITPEQYTEITNEPYLV